jgi:hypothetical protein
MKKKILLLGFSTALLSPLASANNQFQIFTHFDAEIYTEAQPVQAFVDDFDEPIILNASELGKGKHKVGAEVFVSWNKHTYIEKNEERMHSKEIEIDIN